MRVLFVCLIMLAGTMLLGAALAVPTFLAASSQKSALILERENLAKILDAEKGEDTTLEIGDIEGKLAVLSAQASRRTVASVLGLALGHSRGGVSLNSIEIHREKGLAVIILEGRADTRENLVLFSKSLQRQPLFEKVDLPVSSLAKSSDVAFSIRIESNI